MIIAATAFFCCFCANGMVQWFNGSQEKLSKLMGMLEQKSGKMEILRFLTFRLDFNE